MFTNLMPYLPYLHAGVSELPRIENTQLGVQVLLLFRMTSSTTVQRLIRLRVLYKCLQSNICRINYTILNNKLTYFKSLRFSLLPTKFNIKGRNSYLK